MTKDTLLSILRSLLTFGGTFLIGHNLLGHPVDSSTWQIIAGAVITIASTIWGIVDKSAGIEQIQSAVRSLIISVGGIFVADGYLKSAQLNEILGIATAILPILQSYTSRLKVQQINSGQVTVSASGKVVPKPIPQPNPVSPTASTAQPSSPATQN